MNLHDFDYELPEERIAQIPASNRDGSRLLVLSRHSGNTAHRDFDGLPGLLRRGDLLVLNDTRVLPARLIGRKETGGRAELLLVEPADDGEDPRIWIGLVRCSRGPRTGSRFLFSGGVSATIEERVGEQWRVRLETGGEDVRHSLERAGRMPLPPYIRREDDARPPVDDRERYQTVFARNPGSIAAPTAGLHFTGRLLERLGQAGVDTAFVTLHVGPGTFTPVRSERVEDHAMHSERYELPDDAARAVDRTRRRGGRVVAVGTTVVRTLESCANGEGRVLPGGGRSDLFILPGYRFRVVDAVLTNFHLPRSTLLMLVCAFAGRDRVLDAYREAVRREYRFYSYGDAMIVVPS